MVGIISDPTKQPRRADEIGEGVTLDDSVMAKFPPDSKVISVRPSGSSPWAQTVKVKVRLPDGVMGVYFKKGAWDDKGRRVMEGTFLSETALNSAIPELSSKPLGWGTYKTQPDHHFYISEFVELLDRVPFPKKWAETVAKIHQQSAGKSPHGKFGLDMATHLARIPVDNTWNDSWESFWAQQMRSLLEREEEVRGPDAEFSKLISALYDKVIPRLLRPLETGGRKITPCFVHGNLWPGNIKHKVGKDELCAFGGCGFWGHNEADLAVCRNPRYRLGKECITAYKKFMPDYPSHPKEEADDRNALYALKFHVLLSIMYPTEPRYRDIAMNEMRKLTEKFPDGFAAFEAKADEEVEIVDSPVLGNHDIGFQTGGLEEQLRPEDLEQLETMERQDQQKRSQNIFEQKNFSSPTSWKAIFTFENLLGLFTFGFGALVLVLAYYVNLSRLYEDYVLEAS